MSIAFIQFCAIFCSNIDVRWGSGIDDLLLSFSFFNLNFDALHLACAIPTWKERWVVQMMLPVVWILDALLDYVVTKLRHAISRSSRSARSEGTPLPSSAPASSTTSRVEVMKASPISMTGSAATATILAAIPGAAKNICSLQEYAPMLLFYVNMYYLGGLKTSLLPLRCKPMGDREYLLAEPSITCWEGEHWPLVAGSIVGLVVWIVVVPSVCGVVLFGVVRKHHSSRLARRLFGFLFMRFERDCFYWEMIHSGRKLIFSLAASLSHLLQPIEVAVLLCVPVSAVLVLNLSMHPFVSNSYDLHQSVTDIVQLVLLLLGMLLLYADACEDCGNFGFVAPTAWCFIGTALVSIAFNLWQDAQRFYQQRRMRLLRKHTSTALAAGVWDLMFASNLVVDWLEVATPAETEHFAAAESTLAAAKVSSPTAVSDSLRDVVDGLVQTSPYVLDWLLTEPNLERRDTALNRQNCGSKTGDCLCGQWDVAFCVDLLIDSEHPPAESGSPLPLLLCFVPPARAGVLDWAIRSATTAQLQNMREVAKAIRAYEKGREAESFLHLLLDAAQDAGHDATKQFKALKKLPLSTEDTEKPAAEKPAATAVPWKRGAADPPQMGR